MSTPHTQPQGITPQMLRIIRLALMLGPLLIGAVFAFMTMQSGPLLEGDPELAGTLRLISLAIVAAATLGIAAVRRQRAQAPTFQHQASLSIVGWALAEAAAIFGAVYLLLFGSGLVFLVGLLVIGVAFVLLPIPSPS